MKRKRKNKNLGRGKKKDLRKGRLRLGEEVITVGHIESFCTSFANSSTYQKLRYINTLTYTVDKISKRSVGTGYCRPIP